MWVDFQIKYLFTLRRKDVIKKKLGKLPKTLGETYSKIYERILKEDPEELEAAKRSLMWLMCSQRPLSSLEWVNFTYWPELVDPDIGVDSLLEMCHNLVTVDNQSQVVRFTHLSVQEYLENLDDFTTEKANAMAAGFCLSVLLSAGDKKSIPSLLGKSFDYSVSYWMEHASQCTGSQDVLDLLRNFLGTAAKPGQVYCNWFQIGIEDVVSSNRGFDHLRSSLNHLRSEPLNPIFAVCYFQLGTGFQDFWEWDSFDINSRNSDGETLLHIASLAGNERVVKSLLKNGADVNIPCEDILSPSGWNPLTTAIINNQARITVILLDHGAGIGLSGVGQNINTILQFAAVRGDESVIQAMINTDHDTEISEPVLVAAAKNRSHACEILEILVRCPNIEITETVLSAAAMNFKEKALKMLLDRDPTVQITEAILSAAVGNNTAGVEALEELLARDTNIEITEAILTAAMANYRYAKIIDILVRNTWNTNIVVNSTALKPLAYFALPPLFHELLGKCDKSSIPTEKYTQFVYAAVQGGDATILRSLLELGGECSEVDEHGWTLQMVERQSGSVNEILPNVELNLLEPNLAHYGLEAPEPPEVGIEHDAQNQPRQPTAWDNSCLPECIKLQGDGSYILYSGKFPTQLFVPWLWS